MQIRYYDTVWNDVKNSPGWFGKVCLLALVNFIPVLGTIITYGYLYGWAREMSWGVHRPMPEKLICNEDGKFWRRGWFTFVLMFVFGLVPSIIMSAGQIMQYPGMSSGSSSDVGMGAMALIGGALYFVGIVGALLITIPAWVGNMRVSIYDRLSAGFQFDKLRKMLGKDANGIMRIFGMNLLVSLIVGIVLSVFVTVFLFVFIFVGFAGVMNSGYSIESLQHMTDAQAVAFLVQLIGSAGIVGFICLLLTVFVMNLGTVFVDVLVIRALGYWTIQFDVPHWRGQDEPLPFELYEAQWAQQPQPAAWQNEHNDQQ